MIPSVPVLRALRQTLRQFTAPTTSVFSPLSSVQVRHASILGDLRDIVSAHRTKKRVGRGPSSGKGKTAGRGHKGQGQRSGKPKTADGRAFEGGQTPMWVTHPEKGFDNVFQKRMDPLNLERIQSWIDQGRIDPSKHISFKELLDSRCLHGVHDGVVLLGNGADKLTTPINITVSRASRTAIKRIEELGGTVLTRFFTNESIKSITHPHLFPGGYRLPDATSRKDIEYYRDVAHRGYLSDQVKQGETPSLFWYRKGEPGVAKTEEDKEAAKKNRELRKASAENKMW